MVYLNLNSCISRMLIDYLTWCKVGVVLLTAVLTISFVLWWRRKSKLRRQGSLQGPCLQKSVDLDSFSESTILDTSRTWSVSAFATQEPAPRYHNARRATINVKELDGTSMAYPFVPVQCEPRILVSGNTLFPI